MEALVPFTYTFVAIVYSNENVIELAFSFSAADGSNVFVSDKIPIQSVEHSVRRYRNTGSTSFAHAQEGVIIVKQKFRGPAAHVTFSWVTILASNQIRLAYLLKKRGETEERS